jgi:hypothetical protein
VLCLFVGCPGFIWDSVEGPPNKKNLTRLGPDLELSLQKYELNTSLFSKLLSLWYSVGATGNGLNPHHVGLSQQHAY